MLTQLSPALQDDLDAELLRLLADGHPGKGPRPHGITVYQALDRMAQPLYQVVTANALGGHGRGGTAGLAGSQFVQRGMSRLVKKGLVDYIQVDSRGITFDVKADTVRAGFPVTTFYFLK